MEKLHSTAANNLLNNPPQLPPKKGQFDCRGTSTVNGETRVDRPVNGARHSPLNLDSNLGSRTTTAVSQSGASNISQLEQQKSATDSQANSNTYDDIPRQITQEIFTDCQLNSKDFSYNNSRILMYYFDADYVLSLLEDSISEDGTLKNNTFFKDVLDSKDTAQYQYIIELLHHQTTKGMSRDRSFKFVDLLTNAIFKLPQDAKNNPEMYGKLYSLLILHLDENKESVIRILSNMQDKDPDTFFNLDLERHELTVSPHISYTVNNNYLRLLKKIAATENSNSGESIAFKLLNNSLIYIIKAIGKGKANKITYTFFATAIKNIIIHFNEHDKNQIINTINANKNISHRFKEYLEVAIFHADTLTSTTNHRFLDISSKDIDRTKLNLKECMLPPYLSAPPTTVYNPFNATQRTAIKQLVNTKADIWKYQAGRIVYNQLNSDELMQRRRIINNFKANDLTANLVADYSNMMSLLQICSTNVAFEFLDQIGFLVDVITKGTVEEQKRLMALLFQKISDPKLTANQIQHATNIMQQIAHVMTKKEFDISVYSKFFQLLSSVTAKISSQNACNILNPLINSKFNKKIFNVEINESTNAVINNYFTVLTQIAKKSADTQEPGYLRAIYESPASALEKTYKTEACLLLSNLLPYITENIRTKHTTEYQAKFYATEIVNIIKYCDSSDQTKIMKLFFKEKNISKKFKQEFFIGLRDKNISVDPKDYSMSAREIKDKKGQSTPIQIIETDKIKFPTQFLTTTQAENLAKFDISNKINNSGANAEHIVTAEQLQCLSDDLGLSAIYGVSTNSISSIDRADLKKRIDIIQQHQGGGYLANLMIALNTYNDANKVITFLTTSSLVNDILNQGNQSDCLALIEFLFTQTQQLTIDTQAKSKQIIGFTKNIIEYLEQKNTDFTANLYNKVYLLLSACANFNSNLVIKLLKEIGASNSNNKFTFQEINGIANNDYLSLIEAISMLANDAQTKKNLLELINMFLCHIEADLDGNSDHSLEKITFFVEKIFNIIKQLDEKDHPRIIVHLIINPDITKIFKYCFNMHLKINGIELDIEDITEQESQYYLQEIVVTQKLQTDQFEINKKSITASASKAIEEFLLADKDLVIL